jgi:hypothetical protein
MNRKYKFKSAKLPVQEEYTFSWEKKSATLTNNRKNVINAKAELFITL